MNFTNKILLKPIRTLFHYNDDDIILHNLTDQLYCDCSKPYYFSESG